MAALMTSMMGNEEHIGSYIRNCKEMGIEIFPPSINESFADFTAEYGIDEDGKSRRGVRFGLLAIKHVGTGIVNSIIKSREKYGVPNDIFEFIGNLDVKELNKRAIESLIKSGAMDCLDKNRAAMLMVYEDAVSSAQLRAKNSTKDQISIFQMDDKVKEEVSKAREMPDIKNFDKKTLLALEKEELGIYISGHPLDEYTDLISKNVNCFSTDFMINKSDSDGEDIEKEVVKSQKEQKFNDGDEVLMAGVLTGVKTMITKRGDEMARSLLEDFYGTVNLIFFPKLFQKQRRLIRDDAIVSIKGSVSYKEKSEVDILVNNISSIGDIVEFGKSNNHENHRPVKIKVDSAIRDEAGGERKILEKIFELLANYPGNREVLIYLPGRKSTKLGDKYKIDLTGELKDKLIRWFGESNIKE